MTFAGQRALCRQVQNANILDASLHLLSQSPRPCQGVTPMVPAAPFPRRGLWVVSPAHTGAAWQPRVPADPAAGAAVALSGAEFRNHGNSITASILLLLLTRLSSSSASSGAAAAAAAALAGARARQPRLQPAAGSPCTGHPLLPGAQGAEGAALQRDPGQPR